MTTLVVLMIVVIIPAVIIAAAVKKIARTKKRLDSKVGKLATQAVNWASSDEGKEVISNLFSFKEPEWEAKEKENRKYSYDPDSEVWPFEAKPLLTAPERVLYLKLKLAVPETLIFAQVDLGQILNVKKGNDYKAWRNRINRMSVDFVICDKNSSIICCIELDDASHLRDDRKEADAKKDKAITSAGLKMVRFPVKGMPSPKEMRAAIYGVPS